MLDLNMAKMCRTEQNQVTNLLRRVLIVVIKVLLSLLLFFLLLKRLAYETGNLALSPWLLSPDQESSDLV